MHMLDCCGLLSGVVMKVRPSGLALPLLSTVRLQAALKLVEQGKEAVCAPNYPVFFQKSAERLSCSKGSISSGRIRH